MDISTDSYAAIYLSPHLDDVALSCGGSIYQHSASGKRVLIVTVAAGRPENAELSRFARQLHHYWGLGNDRPAAEVIAEVVRKRRAEDLAACRRLGADSLHWPIPDCIYRCDPETGRHLYASEAAIFGSLDPADGALLRRLSNMMAGLPDTERVIAPLGLGNHVDHQLVRLAAESCFGARLFYYEDYPYVQRTPEALGAMVGGAGSWRSELFLLNQEAESARLEAIIAYHSQIPVLFGDLTTLRASVSSQIAATGGERLWQRTVIPTGPHLTPSA